MARILQSPATVLTAAFLTFFMTLFLLLRLLPLGVVTAAAREPLAAEDDPSWKFHNPDIDQWIGQIKEERESLAVREQQLKEWEARLAAEGREIAAVTQAVTKTQAEFDKRILLYTDQEKDNIKRQIKVIANMTPEGAVSMVDEMPDGDAVRLLYTMKPDVSGPILDTMSKLGGDQAKRAELLTKRIRDILLAPATNNLTANAAR